MNMLQKLLQHSNARGTCFKAMENVLFLFLVWSMPITVLPCTDESGVIRDGKTCTQLVTASTKSECYDGSLETKCCVTCASVALTIPDCKYGDRFVSCKSDSCGSFIVRQACCQTCYVEPSPTNGAVTNMGRTFHTAFIKHTGASGEFLIVTAAPEARISVKGMVTTFPLTADISITREKPFSFPMPKSYWSSPSTRLSWTKDDNVLRFTSDVDVGVRLTMRNDKTRLSAVTALPDAALGTEYRLNSGSKGTENQVVIIGTQDDTEVTFTWGQYDITGLTIDNVPVSGTTHQVTLNEFQTLNMVCLDCWKITVTSNKVIGVLAGKDTQRLIESTGNKQGHTFTQNIPSKFAGTSFVVFGQTASELGVSMISISHKDITLSTSKAETKCRNDYQSYVCNDGDEMRIYEDEAINVLVDTPVIMYGSITGSKGNDPTTYAVPSTDQYSTRQMMYMEKGFNYQVTIVSAALAGISVRVVTPTITIGFTGRTLGDDPQFAFRTEDVESLTTSVKYQTYVNGVDFKLIDIPAPQTEKGLVEFLAAEPNKPFLLLVNEFSVESKGVATALPFGLKYVLTYSSSECVTSPTVQDDGIDNDCDGRVDEELLNNIDDDGDGRVDEDLAPTDLPIDCQLSGLAVVKNAIISTTDSSIGPGEAITYTCNTGFTHGSGTLVRTCTGGILSGTPPTCTGVLNKN